MKKNKWNNGIAWNLDCKPWFDLCYGSALWNDGFCIWQRLDVGIWNIWFCVWSINFDCPYLVYSLDGQANKQRQIEYNLMLKI